MQLRKSVLATALIAGLGALSGNASADVDVALNKPVSITGVFGIIGTGAQNPGGWPDVATYPLPLPGRIVDGSLQHEGDEWQVNSIWWNAHLVDLSGHNALTIDLQGTYVINSFVVQADDNDVYQLDYRDTGGNWNSAWTVPEAGSYGATTRTLALTTPLTATALRIYAPTGSGDLYYAVTQVEAFGQPVPEPETWALMAAGLGLLGLARRRI